MKKLLLIILFCSACSFSSKLDRPEEGGYQELPILEKERVLQDIRQDLLDFKTIRAKSNLHVEKKIGSKDLVQIFVAKRPDKFRLELFVPGINHLTAIVLNRFSELTYVDFVEKEAYQGVGDRQTMEKIISVPIAVRDLIIWLSGKAFLPDMEIRKYTVYRSAEKILLKEEFNDGRIVRFFLSEILSDRINKKYAVDYLEISSKENDLIFQSTFSYENLLPKSITFSLPEQSAKGRIDFDKFIINPDLSKTEDKLFNFQVPEEMKIYPLQ